MCARSQRARATRRKDSHPSCSPVAPRRRQPLPHRSYSPHPQSHGSSSRTHPLATRHATWSPIPTAVVGGEGGCHSPARTQVRRRVDGRRAEAVAGLSAPQPGAARRFPDLLVREAPVCDAAHPVAVRPVNPSRLAYHITAQWVRESFPVTRVAVVSSFPRGTASSTASTRVPRPRGPRQRQTSRKAGTQSPEATARSARHASRAAERTSVGEAPDA